jgi:cobalt-zinc-cadmium efflux system protein
VNLLVAWLLSHSHDLNTRAAFLHVVGDLLGSLAAIVAGAVVWLGGPAAADPLLSLLVAGLILRSSLLVLRDCLHVLMDGVPPHLEYGRLGDSLARVPGVLQVADLHVWAMVPGRVALSARLLVEGPQCWPAVLRDARRLLHDDFGIAHATLQPEWLQARFVRVPIRDASPALPATAGPAEPAGAAGRPSMHDRLARSAGAAGTH